MPPGNAAIHIEGLQSVGASFRVPPFHVPVECFRDALEGGGGSPPLTFRAPSLRPATSQ